MWTIRRRIIFYCWEHSTSLERKNGNWRIWPNVYEQYHVMKIPPSFKTKCSRDVQTNCHVKCPHWSAFQHIYSFQASPWSPDRGHVLDICVTMIIWDFGWLNPHHACKTQSDELCPTCPSFPVAKAGRMSVLSAHSCHKSLHAWHAQCTGSSGQQIVWLVGSEGIRQIHGVLLGTDSLIWDPYQDCVFHLHAPVGLTWALLMCQHLCKTMSQFQTWPVTEKH